MSDTDHEPDEDERTVDDEPDDQDDSIETFRAEWLNQWPADAATTDDNT